MNNLPAGIEIKGNALNFGNYEVKEKIKINDFGHEGAMYNLRSYSEANRLEKNNELLLETIPGSFVYDFVQDESNCKFGIKSNASNVQITLGLLPEVSYELAINGKSEHIKANIGGKVSFSVEILPEGSSVVVSKINA